MFKGAAHTRPSALCVSICEGDADIINDVIEVPMDFNVAGVASFTVGNWINTAAGVILSNKGLSLSNFTHVMNVIPSEASW